jgi:hypothetical protein
MFHHDCPLAVTSLSMPWCTCYPNKLGGILCLLICSFLLCLSCLSRCRVRKFWRDLRITLYYNHIISIFGGLWKSASGRTGKHCSRRYVPIYQSTWHHISDVSDLNSHCCHNFKSQTNIHFVMVSQNIFAGDTQVDSVPKLQPIYISSCSKSSVV